MLDAALSTVCSVTHLSSLSHMSVSQGLTVLFPLADDDC